MSLSEQNESDIVALVTGTGLPAARARAMQLLESDREAAEFARQIRSLESRLRFVEPAEPEMLSEAQAEALVTAITERTARKQAARRLLRRRWLAGAGGLAACIALAWLLSAQAYRWRHPTVAQGVWTTATSALDESAGHMQIRRPVRLGESIFVEPEDLDLRFPNGTEIVASAHSRIVCRSRSGDFDLVDGAVYVIARQQLVGRTEPQIVVTAAAGTTFTLSNAAGQVFIIVNEGRLDVSIKGTTTTLIGPQGGVWTRGDSSLSVVPVQPQTPGWAQHMMEAAREW